MSCYRFRLVQRMQVSLNSIHLFYRSIFFIVAITNATFFFFHTKYFRMNIFLCTQLAVMSKFRQLVVVLKYQFYIYNFEEITRFIIKNKKLIYVLTWCIKLCKCIICDQWCVNFEQNRRSKVVYDSQRRRNRINNSKDEFRTSKFNTMPQL